jgi:hypothetical protein
MQNMKADGKRGLDARAACPRNPGPKTRLDSPHCAEPVIGRRFAPTRWLHAGYIVLAYEASAMV